MLCPLFLFFSFRTVSHFRITFSYFQHNTQMREERDEELLVEARKYVETEQEGGGVFYLNVETGEAATSPPPSGYTKKDGLLVLSTGKVIEDPFTNMTPEEKKAKLLEKKCSECEDRNATRKCDQCGDKYCASCYDETHTTGARVHHVWQRLGHIECVECEGVPKVHEYLSVLALLQVPCVFDVVSEVCCCYCCLPLPSHPISPLTPSHLLKGCCSMVYCM